MVKANSAANYQRLAKVNEGEPVVFRTIEEILANKPDESGVLVGDCQIMKGAVCVIAGPPGCGKSTIAFDLAVAGVTKSDWMGLPVHRPFKTLIVQTENGAIRLYRDAKSLMESGDPITFGDEIRISNPPEFGSDFSDEGFCNALRKELDRTTPVTKSRTSENTLDEGKSKGPDVVVLDPWNNFCAGDAREATIEAIKAMRAIFGSGENAPAIVVVAHCRKGSGSGGQKEPEPHELLNEISGSYTLGAHARSAFFAKPDKKEGSSNRIQWTCVKNNNGEVGKAVYFQRKEGSTSKGRFELDKDQTAAVRPIKKQRRQNRGEQSSTERLASVLSAVSSAGSAGVARSDLIDMMVERFGIAGKSATNFITELVKTKCLAKSEKNIVAGEEFNKGLKVCGVQEVLEKSGSESGAN